MRIQQGLEEALEEEEDFGAYEHSRALKRQ
jgi:hypothetical protein